ncbi:MAG: hypothetical protein C5B49_03440 [Bdellovibrio sp.]|nr:MAG: hypothetical protein C5B49_03440 [Bdellovibrio sp.]
MRDGYPDWLLLKKDDVWTGESFGGLCAPGRSMTEPAIISSYGTGARPLVKTPSNFGYAIGAVAGAGCPGTAPIYLENPI